MKELSPKQQWAMEKMVELCAALPSQEEACKQVGISSGVYTPIKKGTYTGNVDNQLKKMIEYFETKEAASELNFSSGYKNTSISTQICKALKLCQIKGGMTIISGDAGIGKTKACRHFYEENSRSTVLIEANTYLKSQRTILELIGEQLGVALTSSAKMWQQITAKLSDGMIIVVDEAQHLTGSTIDGIRSFCDVFDERGQTLGLALVGNPSIYQKIQKAGFEQLDNRVKNDFQFGVKRIKASDIQLIFPQIANDKAAVEFMLRVAQTKEGLRGAENLFLNALDAEDISCKGLANEAKKISGLVI